MEFLDDLKETMQHYFNFFTIENAVNAFSQAIIS